MFEIFSMAQRFSLEAKTRKDHVGAVRGRGFLPAVLYGHGIKSISLEVNLKDFTKVFRAAGSTSLVELKLEDGKAHNVIIRDAQHHPVRSNFLHVDFYQVRLDEEIRAKVQLRFTGESPAVKDMGGVLVRSVDEIDLSALPQHLPHDIEVDISVLDQFDKVIRIADLPIPKEATVFHEQEDVVALVQAPRTQEEIDEELAADTTEDVASVEGVEDKEPEAEGASEGEAPAEGDKPAAEPDAK